MLLLRDQARAEEMHQLAGDHTRLVRQVHAGRADLRAVQGAKLAAILAAAAGSSLYRHTAAAGLTGSWHGLSPEAALTQAFPRLPLLSKQELADYGGDAFTRRLPDFLHYYESSGTTGDPVAAPKALDDLIINTINIGELWAQLLQPGDVALILINAPFAPAAYQFEKVLEYLGVMSLRPWVDNITGDYARVLRLITTLGVNVFVGPASRLLELIQFACRSGMPAPRFDHLLLMAEQTGPGLVRHLERLTGGSVYNGSYGSSETATTAVTCGKGSLHLQVHSYILELSGEPGTQLAAEASGRGELVVTTLDLPARPLLRYRTGDLVEVSAAECPCGVRTPLVRPLGRAQDVLALSGSGVRQDDLEDALWSQQLPDRVIFNYMVVVRERDAVLLVTTDGAPTPAWTAALDARLARVFPGITVTVRPVEVLPPLASLGQYLGWKMSRVLDLNEEAGWQRLPAPLRAIVAESLSIAMGHPDGGA